MTKEIKSASEENKKSEMTHFLGKSKSWWRKLSEPKQTQNKKEEK